MTLSRKELLIFTVIFLLFVAIHILAIHFPYHQDEYKWVLYSHPEIITPGTVPHPPLTEFIYTKIGPVFGDMNFRFIPFIFGMLNFFLLFYLSKTIFSKKVALWTIFLFTISFYSLLATLMVDVDGAVMPMLFLIMSIGYFKWKESLPNNASNWKWLALIIIGAIGGFLIKVSAILPIITIFLDFLVEKQVFRDKKKILKYLLYAVGGGTILVFVLLLAKFIFPFFNLSYALKYWEHFAVFAGRGWMQTFIQFFKSILYTSPLLILPAFLAGKEIFRKTRVFYLFIFVGIFFYIFAFDFSIGALDRFFQFLIIPLCLISGSVFAGAFEKFFENIKKSHIISLILLIAFLVLIQFIPHTVPSLHPKAEWVGRILSLKWNFLYPFTGGSGPLGFYVSFLFIGLVWIISSIFFLIAWFKISLRNILLISIFALGFLYNGVFREEYLFGWINGSAPKVLAGAVEYIKNNNDIKSVTVYNDNGGYDIQNIGKYHKRLYTDPKFGVEEKMVNLNLYKEHYLEVNIPRIDPNSFYRRYLDSCEVIYKKTDKSISAIVYNCESAPDVKL